MTKSPAIDSPLGFFPRRIDSRVRFVAWLNLVWQVVLVFTGGAVRLTDSGLGCPKWPDCTTNSLVNTPAMGIHGIIEFSNRTLTFVLLLVTLAMIVVLWRLRKTHRTLFVLSIVVFLGIPTQALIGGFSVLTRLNPYVVGLHFVASMFLVALTTIIVIKCYPPARDCLPGSYRPAATLIDTLLAVTIILGILTTGSGPHAGDANAPRSGLLPVLMQTIHSIAAYALFAIVLLVLGTIWSKTRSVRRHFLAMTLVMILQIIVGVVQSNTALPEWLVLIHMVLAACLVATGTASVFRLRQAVKTFASFKANESNPAATLANPTRL